LRHTPEGGEVRVSARRDGAAARIEVRDTGDGIDPSDHERVFERLYRVEGGRSGEGAGLGLAIVRRIVDLHGGTVRLESARGSGTRVSFTLPVAKSP
jgi:signal transduction histidine kinase